MLTRREILVGIGASMIATPLTPVVYVYEWSAVVDGVRRVIQNGQTLDWSVDLVDVMCEVRAQQ